MQTDRRPETNITLFCYVCMMYINYYIGTKKREIDRERERE